MLPASVLAALLLAECLRAPGDRIRAGDLAGALPEFASVPAGTVLGLAPAVGARRIYQPVELEALGRLHGVNVSSQAAICVERPSRVLTPADLAAALRSVLGETSAGIEILDFSRFPVPPGALLFPKAGVVAMVGRPGPKASPVLWRGQVADPSGGTVSIWVRARIWEMRSELRLRKPVGPLQKLEPDDLEVVEAERFPLDARALDAPEAALGMRLKRRLAAGAAIHATALEAAKDVERGDTVQVDVESGRAVLRLSARAETAGRTGETVMLKNPANGQRFQGRVAAPGKVLIQAGARHGS
ncbi:MAG: flagellar basal body P-ring formation protein FlgA [Acidobacteria bacterium]|nr:flagellar basal body P-ring formation protein FlgA [Acidobacteriota bacterium]